MAENKVTEAPVDIVELFDNTVKAVKKTMTTGDESTRLNNAVDLRITLKGVSVTANGGLGIFRKKESNTMEIELVLATRITPD